MKKKARARTTSKPSDLSPSVTAAVPPKPTALASVSSTTPRRGGGVGATIKNLAILGIIGVGGFYLWKKIGTLDIGGPAKGGGKPSAPAVPAPDLKGPKVVKGEKAATLSQICITQGDPKFVYAPIEQIDQNGYQSFTAPVRGNFTRRLLCAGGKKWAEISPKKFG